MRRLVLAASMAVALVACGGGSNTPPLAADLEAGRTAYGANCSICHGGTGQGASAPALFGIVTTFGECDDHIAWITMGSDRHKAEVGPTYGDTGTPITAVMPSFESVLTARQIAQVAAFERFRFGGREQAAALGECGL